MVSEGLSRERRTLNMNRKSAWRLNEGRGWCREASDAINLVCACSHPHVRTHGERAHLPPPFPHAHSNRYRLVLSLAQRGPTRAAAPPLPPLLLRPASLFAVLVLPYLRPFTPGNLMPGDARPLAYTYDASCPHRRHRQRFRLHARPSVAGFELAPLHSLSSFRPHSFAFLSPSVPVGAAAHIGTRNSFTAAPTLRARPPRYVLLSH